MERIENRFQVLKEKNPYWSSIITFSNAIMGKGFGKMAIGQAFQKLVSKDDFSRSDRDRILEGLNRL